MGRQHLAAVANCSGRIDVSIRLYLEFDFIFQRVGLAVACELDSLVLHQLCFYSVPESVIFFPASHYREISEPVVLLVDVFLFRVGLDLIVEHIVRIIIITPNRMPHFFRVQSKESLV